MAGYSGRTLAEKLGLKPGMTVLVLAAPEGYGQWIGLDFGFQTHADDGMVDFVHLFARSQADLDALLPAARRAIRPDGMIWVSWLKQAARIPTDLTEDVIRNRALAGDLVDVKVCAVSDIWSGLKLVVRKGLRKG
ncbi:MAG: hypothetical protein JWM33_2901 [Caulobacteraceae bacterium]|nr:hypothetical protein [Caulobacteraceae bacterium]